MAKTLLIRALLAGACSLALSTPAIAQTTADSGESNEIIVTAQNRSENVQDVPIAIDVITAAEIQKSGLTDFREIERIAPAINITNDNGAVRVTLRGIGTNSNDEAQDTSIVVNIDGEYINRPNVLNASLFDIERVEVLRGPQGTLYGRNSTGGAINFITKKAGKEFGFNAVGSYGNYNTISLEGGVDIPFGDIGAIRVAGIYKENDGYFFHPNLNGGAGARSGADQVYGGRASLRLNPSDALSIDLSVEYSEREYGVPSQAFANLNAPGNAPTGPGCNVSGFVQVAPAITAANGQILCIPSNTNFLAGINRKRYTAANFGPSIENSDSTVIRGRIAYDLGDATISYIGGYRSSGRTGALGLPVIFRGATFLDDTKTQSHELRVNGETSGGIIYQVGGFYFRETLDRESGFFLPVLGPNGGFLTYFTRDVTSDSKSVFGQVDLPIGDKLTAVAGIRYTDNKRSAIFGNYPFLVNTGFVRVDLTNRTPTPLPPLGNKEDKATWLAGLNYKPNSDTLIYAKVATGFKGGGFDSVGPYAPETNTAYELGLKKNFGPSAQHIFNASAFYYDYKDLQVSVLLNTAVGGQTFNAGKATIKGLEAELDIKLSDNDRFNASFNYLDAQYDQLLAQFNVFCVGGCGTTGVGDLDPVAPGVQQPNFAGNKAPFSPKYTITLGYDHIFLIGSGAVTASAFTRLKSSYFTDFFNYRDGQQSAFTQTDLSLEYKPEDEKFSVQLFARNLENVRPLAFGSFIAAGPDDIYNFQFGTPRTYGIRLGVKF